MILRDEQQNYAGIRCDAPDCTVEAPPIVEIKQAHGLIRLGWACSGGTHYCPEHNDEA